MNAHDGEHDHLHDDHGPADDHGHAGHHHHSLPVSEEEPLDPGNQSLADALRASFRVLKGLMCFLVALYLVSGSMMVDQNEVRVVSRFGKQSGPPREPGLHWGLPYPIDIQTKVPTSLRTLTIDSFWLNLADAEKGRDLNEIVRGGGLDPRYDGAVLTGDRGIMHLLTKVQYRVSNANDFVKNVSDEEVLLKTILEEATVAAGGRTTADTLWRDPKQVVEQIKIRAQDRLEALGAGITIDAVNAEKSHYPLQVKEEFLAVPAAENYRQKAIQEANKDWEERLKGAAGEAWEQLSRDIERLDQVTDESKRKEIFASIDKVLVEQATGDAGRKIQLAKSSRDELVSDAQSRSERFKALLEAYRANPELVKQRLRQDMIGQIFSKAGISRWFLPEGNKVIWLNKDPEEIRQRDREALRNKLLGKK
jgi:modulator of FtsH protease HflK